MIEVRIASLITPQGLQGARWVLLEPTETGPGGSPLSARPDTLEDVERLGWAPTLQVAPMAPAAAVAAAARSSAAGRAGAPSSMPATAEAASGLGLGLAPHARWSEPDSATPIGLLDRLRALRRRPWAWALLALALAAALVGWAWRGQEASAADGVQRLAPVAWAWPAAQGPLA